MKLSFTVLGFFMFWGVPQASAQTAADSAGIIAAALGYVEGWNRADAETMERALHTDLVKRTIAGDGASLAEMGADQLVRITGRQTRNEEFDGRDRVKILDIFRDISTVRTDFDDWVDHLQIARIDGEWKIVNVLWQVRAD